MSEKGTNNATKTQENETGLSTRQLRVLDKRLIGVNPQSVQQIAEEIGVERTTIYRDLAKIKESGWFERQTAKMQTVEGLVFAGFLSRILKADPRLIKAYYKGLGVWRDKLEVSGTIEQKLSDQEITDKVKAAILDVIQEVKSKGQVKGAEIKQIERSKGQGESQDDKDGRVK